MLSVVYVHDIRHLSVAFATGLLAVNAMVGLVASPLIGTMTDRRGPVPVYVTLVACEVAATVSWAFADTWWWLLVTSVVLAACGGALFGPGAALLSRLVPEHLRQQAFGTNFMILNLGIGLGGLVSAAVVDLERPATFTWLYLGTAAFVAPALIPMVHIRRLGGPVPDDSLNERELGEGWREVLADHRLVHFVLASIVLVTFAYGSLDSGFSLFVVDQAHLAVRVVSIALFFNTVTIVILQLFVLRTMEGRSRTRVLAAVSVFWAASWLVIGASVHVHHAGADRPALSGAGRLRLRGDALGAGGTGPGERPRSGAPTGTLQRGVRTDLGTVECGGPADRPGCSSDPTWRTRGPTSWGWGRWSVGTSCTACDDGSHRRRTDVCRGVSHTGAGDGNRTRVSSLGSWRSTIELHHDEENTLSSVGHGSLRPLHPRGARRRPHLHRPVGRVLHPALVGRSARGPLLPPLPQPHQPGHRRARGPGGPDRAGRRRARSR